MTAGRWKARVTRVVAFVVLAGVTGCSAPTSSTPEAGAEAPAGAGVPPTAGSGGSTSCSSVPRTSQGAVDERSWDRARDALRLVASVGWNPEAASRVDGSSGRGGLYVNWRPGWDGSVPAHNTDFDTEGRTDGERGSTPRHDPLTDLVVLRDVDTYLAARPGDTQLEQLRCRLEPVVAREFDDYGVFRPWVLDDLVALSALQPSGDWVSRAQRLAVTVAAVLSKGGLGTSGTYRSDYVAEAAAALVHAGGRWRRPDWTAAGVAAARRLVDRAPDTRTGLFPAELRPTAAAADDVLDPQVRTGAQAQLLEALLQVHDVSGDGAVLQAVTRALNSMTTSTTGLVDAAGGFRFAVNADGTHLRSDYVETRSAWMLPLLRHWESSAGVNHTRSDAFRSVVRDRLYRGAGGGYVYRVSPSYGAYVGKAGLAETWVSAEAVGLACQVLLEPST